MFSKLERDHISPIAKGGEDDEKNWVRTSMKNN